MKNYKLKNWNKKRVTKLILNPNKLKTYKNHNLPKLSRKILLSRPMYQHHNLLNLKLNLYQNKRKQYPNLFRKISWTCMVRVSLCKVFPTQLFLLTCQSINTWVAMKKWWGCQCCNKWSRMSNWREWTLPILIRSLWRIWWPMLTWWIWSKTCIKIMLEAWLHLKCQRQKRPLQFII